jgi:hypothetical protein
MRHLNAKRLPFTKEKTTPADHDREYRSLSIVTGRRVSLRLESYLKKQGLEGSRPYEAAQYQTHGDRSHYQHHVVLFAFCRICRFGPIFPLSALIQRNVRFTHRFLS